MEGTVCALEVLERRQAALHATLREAGFALSAAQRVEEQQGNLCTIESVPTATGTLQPLVYLQDALKEDTAHDEREEIAGWSLHVSEATRPALLHTKGQNSKNTKEVVVSEEEQCAVDPLYYFSALPSQELRDCQALYRKALQQVVYVVQAQHIALTAAEHYAAEL